METANRVEPNAVPFEMVSLGIGHIKDKSNHDKIVENLFWIEAYYFMELYISIYTASEIFLISKKLELEDVENNNPSVANLLISLEQIASLDGIELLSRDAKNAINQLPFIKQL